MKMPMKNKMRLLGLVLLAAMTFSGCLRLANPRPGPEYVFPLQSAPPFLSEELAVEQARATLAMEGYNVDQWQLTNREQSGTLAPDGTRDRYLIRYQNTYGRVSFLNGKHYRTYDVSLQGSRVVCRFFRGSECKVLCCGNNNNLEMRPS